MRFWIWLRFFIYKITFYIWQLFSKKKNKFQELAEFENMPNGPKLNYEGKYLNKFDQTKKKL